jgi:hypothetical protein
MSSNAHKLILAVTALACLIAAPAAAGQSSAPKLTIGGSAKASASGVVALSVRNPNAFALRGKVALRSGRKVVASAKLRLPAQARRTLRLRLTRPAARRLATKRELRLSLSATVRGPAGPAATVKRGLSVSAPAKPGTPKPGAPPAMPPEDEGIDGTYSESNGWTMVVEGGRVISFSGTLSLYCTETARQKNSSFGMYADDPDPTVAPDGTFAWEATAGYGFVKLKYQGRIDGKVATGNAVVEDRSPLLGTGRFEFDYCFAGRDFQLAKP